MKNTLHRYGKDWPWPIDTDINILNPNCVSV